MKAKNLAIAGIIACGLSFQNVSATSIQLVSYMPVNAYIQVIEEFYRPVEMNGQNIKIFDKVWVDNLSPRDIKAKDIDVLTNLLEDMRKFLSESKDFSRRELNTDELAYIDSLNTGLKESNIKIRASYLKKGFEIYRRDSNGKGFAVLAEYNMR